MKKSNAVDVAVILKFFNDPLSSFYTIMDKCLSFLSSDPFFKDNPVFWNIPLYPVLEHEYGATANIIQVFKIRMEYTGDSIIPKGYTGAYHSLLMKDELEDEIQWSFSNPWVRNRLEEFNVASHLLMPSDVDFFRPDFKPFYHQSAYDWIITPAFPSHASFLCPITILSHQKTKVVPAYNLIPFRSPSEKPPFKIIKKQMLSNIIICECTDGDIVNTLHYLSETVQKLIKKGTAVTFHRHVSIEHIQQLPPKQSIHHVKTSGAGELFQSLPFIDFPLPAVPSFPSQRLSRHSSFKNRFQKLSPEPLPGDQVNTGDGPEIHANNSAATDKERINKEILLLSSGLKEPSEESGGETPQQRNFLANMTGTTQINESNYIVELNGGRFQNIIIENKRILNDEPVNSFFQFEERDYFEQLTAFSFEDSSEERGLREILQWSGSEAKKDGKIVNDYIFLGDYPYLFISLYVAYPVFHEQVTLSSFALFELPLFNFHKGEAVKVQGVYPDGKSYTYFLAPEEQRLDLPGIHFFFTCKEASFMLVFPQHGEIPIEILPIKISREKKHYTLSINPKGSYRSLQAEQISGIEEHFHMMIAAGAKERINPGKVPESVLSRLKPPWIRGSRVEDYSTP